MARGGTPERWRTLSIILGVLMLASPALWALARSRLGQTRVSTTRIARRDPGHESAAASKPSNAATSEQVAPARSKRSRHSRRTRHVFCTGGRLSPRKDIQAAIDSSREGVRFCLNAGTYELTQPLVPRADQRFVGAGDATIITGGDRTVAAFEGDAYGVKIRKLTVEHFNNPVQGNGAIDTGNGWTVRGVLVRFNHARGIRVGGSNVRIVNSRILSNGQLGIGGGGDGSIIAHNEVAFNNALHMPSGCCAGGIKQGGNQKQIFRKNYVHDNLGPGIWCDAGCVNAVIDGNTVVHNSSQGIMYEVSHDAVIRDNRVTGNGFGRGGNNAGYGAGIMISSSGGGLGTGGIDVYNNVVTNNANGIAVTQQHRGITVQHVWVHDNSITMTGPEQRTGVWSYTASTLGQDVAFSDNHYAVPCGSGAQYWHLNGTVTRWQWVGAGFDATGRSSYRCL